MSDRDICDKQKVVIGGLVNIADTHAKKVLSSYNPAQSYNTNLNNIVKRCNAQQLESCATILGLKVRSDDGKEAKLYRNQELLADRIILKIESLFEAECSDCNSMYQNTVDSVPLFTCRLCLLGSHDCDSIKEKAKNMSDTNPEGFVWLCHVCLQKNELHNLLPEVKPRKRTLSQQSSHQENSEKLDTIREEGSHDDKETPDVDQGACTEVHKDSEEEPVESNEGDDRISPRRGRDSKPLVKEKQNEKKVGVPICELYKRRSCPHGMSGKIVVHGTTCKSEHPKRCFKFCDFGAGNKKGCKKGKKCQYWHPRLCKHSMKNKVCEDLQCTFQHLVFNRRQKDQQQDEPRTSYRREDVKPPTSAPAQRTQFQKQMELKKVSIASSAGYSPYPPTINKPPKEAEVRKKIDEESFLFQLIENMRAGFQEQIDLLRKDIVREKEIHNRPVTMGAPIPQSGGHFQAEVSHPAFRAYPGPFQPSNMGTQYLMAPQAQQWMNQSQSFPPLSS